jgi:hypothetical protein
MPFQEFCQGLDIAANVETFRDILARACSSIPCRDRVREDGVDGTGEFLRGPRRDQESRDPVVNQFGIAETRVLTTGTPIAIARPGRWGRRPDLRYLADQGRATTRYGRIPAGREGVGFPKTNFPVQIERTRRASERPRWSVADQDEAEVDLLAQEGRRPEKVVESLLGT